MSYELDVLKVLLGLALGYILLLELRISWLKGRVTGLGQQMRNVPKRKTDHDKG